MEAIRMSKKELDRIPTLDKIIEEKLTQKQAATALCLSTRQIRRLVKRYEEDGATGIAHAARGREGNRAIPQAEKDRAIVIVTENYPDFGPTFALEKLQEHHGVTFGVDTLRTEMTAAGLWKPRPRRGTTTHPPRQRRACYGELIQVDGSSYAWFEERGPTCNLLVFIDDATSKLMDGMFVKEEGTYEYFAAMEHYLKVHGKPVALYVDRHSTFKVNRQATIEEELRDQQAQSQFERAMEEVGIEVIYAYSPQAKGRVERANGTLQDRLVKEMRLEGISSMEEGTKYFREVYIPEHNKKFAVTAKQKGDLHRPLHEKDNLEKTFTKQSNRIVSNDLQVRYQNRQYQITAQSTQGYRLRKARVLVTEDAAGEVRMYYKERELRITQVGQEPRREKRVQTRKEIQRRWEWKPADDHPWKQMSL